MLQMVYEKEVVLNIRHCIEMCKQQEMFDDNVADKEFTPLEATFEYSHVCLGSRQRGLKIPSYAEDLRETLDFHGFSDSLAEFLCDYACVEVYGSDFSGDGFKGHQHHISWCKVCFHPLRQCSLC